MILDRLDAWQTYRHLHPGFAAAFRFLTATDLGGLAPGRHDVLGEALHAKVDHVEGRTRDGAVLEAHRRFMDIQYTLSGAEEIGWSPAAECREVRQAYDESRDIGFFADRPQQWIAVPPGHFAVFFPQDAHAPLGGEGTLRKVIMKIAVDWPA